MAVLGSRDESYIECISTVDQDASSPLWHEYIRADGGPCAWALRTKDTSRQISRLRDANISADGPIQMARDRPGGAELSWEIAIPGGNAPGEVTPFFISDKTPREWRVSPTPSAANSELTGIERVILAVDDLDHSVEQFYKAFPALPDRTVHTSEMFEADVVQFSDAPPVLAKPMDDSWLAKQLSRFGDPRCGFLLGTTDFERLMTRLLALTYEPCGAIKGLDGREL